MHVSCLFFKPEAVSKNSVSLWIGYSVLATRTLSAFLDFSTDIFAYWRSIREVFSVIDRLHVTLFIQLVFDIIVRGKIKQNRSMLIRTRTAFGNGAVFPFLPFIGDVAPWGLLLSEWISTEVLMCRQANIFVRIGCLKGLKLKITRQIYRYGETAAFRRPQIKHSTASNNWRGCLENETEIRIILTKYEAVLPTFVPDQSKITVCGIFRLNGWQQNLNCSFLLKLSRVLMQENAFFSGDSKVPFGLAGVVIFAKNISEICNAFPTLFCTFVCTEFFCNILRAICLWFYDLPSNPNVGTPSLTPSYVPCLGSRNQRRNGCTHHYLQHKARIGTYGVIKNNPSGNFLTIYWIQTQYILLLGEQVLTLFLCIKRVRLNWNVIVNDVQRATYSSHGAPCPARDLFPWLNTESERTYISMDNTRISEMTFSVLLGFGGYLPTIVKDVSHIQCNVSLI